MTVFNINYVVTVKNLENGIAGDLYFQEYEEVINYVLDYIKRRKEKNPDNRFEIIIKNSCED